MADSKSATEFGPVCPMGNQMFRTSKAPPGMPGVIVCAESATLESSTTGHSPGSEPAYSIVGRTFDRIRFVSGTIGLTVTCGDRQTRVIRTPDDMFCVLEPVESEPTAAGAAANEPPIVVVRHLDFIAGLQRMLDGSPSPGDPPRHFVNNLQFELPVDREDLSYSWVAKLETRSRHFRPDGTPGGMAIRHFLTFARDWSAIWVKDALLGGEAVLLWNYDHTSILMSALAAPDDAIDLWLRERFKNCQKGLWLATDLTGAMRAIGMIKSHLKTA